MKKNNLLLLFLFLIFICHIPIANAADFEWGAVISEYRDYKHPFTASDFYYMLIAAEVDTKNYPVYVQNIPGVSGDTSLTPMTGWDDLTPYTYARGFLSPPPGEDWENKTCTFYIDMIQNGQKDPGEPTTTCYIPQSSISQMALVQNVSISAGYNPTITWDPAPNADTYRIRFVPIKDGNPDFNIGLFQSDYFSGLSSYSFTYTGTLFNDYGPLAVVIEAGEYYNDLMLNRSRYIVQHDPAENAADFEWGAVISEYRHYEPPFTVSNLYVMAAAANVDTKNYPVYVQNVPNTSGDTFLYYMTGWDDLTPHTYARGFLSPPPGEDWENKTYTFYIDMIQNGQKDPGEPTSTWNIPQGSISQMALVQNVSISAGYNPTITWDPAPNADTYRIRFVPIKDGNPDLSIGLFQSEEFSGLSNYSFTYTGNLFNDYGPIAVVIEAWEDYNGYTLNRSRYFVKHDPGNINDDGDIPPAPRGLAANAVSYRKILLRWTDQSTDEDGFKIERKQRGCNSSYAWSQIATVSENVNTYDDVGFDPDTQYSYRVRAYNAYGNSEYSNCGTTVSGVSGTPSAPVNLVATCASASTVDLTWDEWSTNVTEFKIYREVNDSDSWTLLATTGPATFNFSDTKASVNQSATGYCYYVQACNDEGCSPPTYTVCIPFNPSDLTATAGSNGKIVLNWTDNSDNERGFELYRKTGNCSSFSSWEKVKSAGIDRTTLSDKKDMVSGTTHSYKIRAYCRSWGLPYVYGYSDWSDCVSITAP